jgi:hypothetical protein
MDAAPIAFSLLASSLSDTAPLFEKSSKSNQNRFKDNEAIARLIQSHTPPRNSKAGNGSLVSNRNKVKPCRYPAESALLRVAVVVREWSILYS